ncbi:MAG: M28 family peptidase, partial [Bacteroidetes bacterium]|nr:M28 family peptidase [Bacteroidota bacterium]
DSLLSYLRKFGTFHTRNSGSDTVSADTGIGAARRWVHKMFTTFSVQSQNRLIPAYVQFDQNICGNTQHRNPIAILPGSDTSAKGIILMEAHMDSRCETGCDVTCKAHGIEDNGTGSALVMELARVMSAYTYRHTMVFMLTIAEEQGLYGANAFAEYCELNNIPVKAVQNNDVIGGITCGATSSPPSCPFEGHIDSTHLRVFSLYVNNNFSQHRGYARYTKLLNSEFLDTNIDVPMTINIINQEDRLGRGGDHIPFSDRAYTAVRYCAANEHGDASNGVGYTDRQHTVGDILGVDTDDDGIVDSFYVDFNYLRRNALINGTMASLTGMGPETPDFVTINDTTGLYVRITTQQQYGKYRVGVRQDPPTDFEAVCEFQDTIFKIPNVDMNITYYTSVASVNSDGVMSLFSKEQNDNTLVAGDSASIPTFHIDLQCVPASTGPHSQPKNNEKLQLLSAYPNPFTNTTTLSVMLRGPLDYEKAFIRIMDVTGKEVYKLEIELHSGNNSVVYQSESSVSGLYYYSLIIDGNTIATKKMTVIK